MAIMLKEQTRFLEPINNFEVETALVYENFDAVYFQQVPNALVWGKPLDEL